MTETSCSQCGGPGGLPIFESELAVLGEQDQIEAAAHAFGGGALAALGLRMSQRFDARSVQWLAFCGQCRETPASIRNPFRLPKVCAGVGFFCGITLMGTPLAFLLHLVAFLSLRKRLRDFWERPTMSSVGHALDAVETVAFAIVGNLAILAVLGGVVAYMVWFKR